MRTAMMIMYLKLCFHPRAFNGKVFPTYFFLHPNISTQCYVFQDPYFRCCAKNNQNSENCAKGLNQTG